MTVAAWLLVFHWLLLASFWTFPELSRGLKTARGEADR